MGKPKKKQDSQSVTYERKYNKDFSSRGRIYKRPDKMYSEFSRPAFKNVYVRNRECKQTYSTYKPHYGSHDAYFKRKTRRKPPSRPPSPILGSEEYMDRKIQQTSAIIMRQLLSPDEQVIACAAKQTSNNETKNCPNENANENIEEKPIERSNEKSDNETENNKSKKKLTSYDIEEIHKKIISHITNLNNGKKKNLVLSNTSSYDIAIQQIQKQKRLEISQALRNMCTQSETQESSDYINSIIPDMGIKIEDLPRELIEELTNTLNLGYESGNCASNFLNHLSQDTGYSSLGESQPNGENILNENINLGGEQYLQPVIKLEHTELEPFLFTNDTVNCNVYNSTKDGETIENISIKKEPDQHTENVNIESQASNEIIECLVPDTHKNIEERIEDNVIEIKQEVKENVENDCIDTVVSNDVTKSLFPVPYNEVNQNADTKVIQIKQETDQHTDIENLPPDGNVEVEHNLLPITLETNDELQEKTAMNENKICDCHKKESSDYLNSVKRTLDNGTQTDEFWSIKTIASTLLSSKTFKKSPKTISNAVKRMVEIDELILKLTEYRQDLFVPFQESKASRVKNKSKQPIKKRKKKQEERNNKKKIKRCNQQEISNQETCSPDNFPFGTNEDKVLKNSMVNNDEDCFIVKDSNKTEVNPMINKLSVSRQQNMLIFPEVQEKMLVIKVINDKLVGAAESGKIFICSLEDGHCMNVLQVSCVPITALWFEKIDKQDTQMYVGSFENNLKVYDLCSHLILRTINIDDSIQCLESNWGYIFMGCIRGTLMRYSIKKNVLEYEDKLSDDRILVIKATQEGARRILLVGSRNSPVCIRDAMTGLYMRTMDNIISPTVYSLIMEKSLVYCGTTNHDILVYSFHDGKLVNTYEATSSKGISCLKIIKNLLFASCHNGNIYAYDIKANQFIDSIQGPGGVILSMEVLENQVIVGTMTFKFTSIPIPQHILKYNDG